MSELEFQRELSPEQIREALLLLDRAVPANTRNLQVADSTLAKEADPCSDQTNSTVPIQSRLGGTEDPQQRKKHLSRAAAFYGLGIAAAAAATLLSWSERALTSTPLPGIAREQLPNQPATKPVNGASLSLSPADPTPDEISGGSERRPLKQELTGPVPVGQPNHSDDPTAAGDAASSASAVPYTARLARAPAAAGMQDWWNERTSRKTKQGWWRARPVQVAAAKSRYWRRHWRSHTETNNGECFFSFVCSFSRNQRAFYEPPRNLTQ